MRRAAPIHPNPTSSYSAFGALVPDELVPEAGARRCVVAAAGLEAASAWVRSMAEHSARRRKHSPSGSAGDQANSDNVIGSWHYAHQQKGLSPDRLTLMVRRMRSSSHRVQRRPLLGSSPAHARPASPSWALSGSWHRLRLPSHGDPAGWTTSHYAAAPRAPRQSCAQHSQLRHPAQQSPLPWLVAPLPCPALPSLSRRNLAEGDLPSLSRRNLAEGDLPSLSRRNLAEGDQDLPGAIGPPALAQQPPLVASPLWHRSRARSRDRSVQAGPASFRAPASVRLQRPEADP